jgi:hypothetical protein
MRPAVARAVLLACLLAVLATIAPAPAQADTAQADTAQAAPQPAASQPTRHVVIVGVSGLRWSEVSPTATPALWRLASQGSVGSLVDYAVLPLTCPADAWLTLNTGARAQSNHNDVSCGTFPAVVPAGHGAQVPGLGALESYNQQFHNTPDWGLLASAASCTTAVGPGAALALASRSGQVASYLPSAAALTAAVLSRCPLTVVDLGNQNFSERSALSSLDTQLARLTAELPPNTTLLLVAPGATTKPPHLQLALVSGPGYASGLLDAASTRQPGMVVLTDLTSTVLGWLGRPQPAAAVGAKITRGDRGAIAPTVRSLASRDTAEQVWRSTHSTFFWVYALADGLAMGGIGLACWGAAPERRRRRARLWRLAGVIATAVPVATFLADLVPWSQSAHPAAALYGAAAVITAAVAAAALAGPWRRDRFGPFGVICLATLVVLGLDVMTGSRLQQETPFGLSVLEAGRFYGIGNEALGIYGVTALFGAAWLALLALRLALRRPAPSPSARPSARRLAVLVVSVVGVFAVFASGWPGFGGKVGGTIAMVPCFALLGMFVAGIRLNWRRVLLVAVSGLALFVVFALISYFVPATGKSDIGSFAGSALHGHAGSVLLRKIHSNIGSLSVNALSPLAPVVVVVAGLMLWRPSWFALKTVPLAYAAEPLLGPVLGVLWLLPVLGWFADDSGVIVPATVLPLVLPLGIAILAVAAYGDREPRYLDTTVAGPSDSKPAGQPA